MRAVLDAATYFAVASLVLRRRPTDPITWLVLALATLTLVPLMLERPWHYTIVLTILCLRGAERMQSGDSPGRWWWLPVAFAFWANVHIQFVLGLGVLGLGWLVAAATRPGFAWRPWLGLGVACAAATLVNPYHIRLYVVVFEYATQTGALRVVQELAPPDFSQWWNWPLLVLLAWGAVTCVRSRSAFDIAFLVVAAFFALRMQRDLWFGSAVAAMVVTRTAPQAEDRLPFRVLGAATAGAFLLTTVLGAFIPNRSPREAERLHYPAEAVAYLKANRPPGPIFNHFDTGGYLIWKLPDYPVSIDGRTNLYGEARLERSMRTWQGQDWEADPDLMAARVVLVPKRTGKALGDELRKHPDRWRVAFEDEVAIVFVRAG